MITNHKLLNFRIVSILVAAVFTLDVYIDVNEYFMFPLFILQLVTFLLALLLKKKRKEKSLVIISRGGSIALLLIYICAIVMGVFVSMTTSRPVDAIFLLLIYVVILDALMSIPFVLSFTEGSRWRSGYGTSDGGRVSGMTPANGVPIIGCSDSSGTTPTLWPAGHHSNDIHIESPGVNPTTGLPMANGAVDVGGNLYGMNHDTYNSVTGSGYTDYSGSSYSSSTSDYSHDYNNDFGRNS